MKKVLSVIAFCISASTVFGFKTKGGEDVIIGYTTCEDACISVGSVTINALVWWT